MLVESNQELREGKSLSSIIFGKSDSELFPPRSRIESYTQQTTTEATSTYSIHRERGF
jgi:hypothetical protein